MTPDVAIFLGILVIMIVIFLSGKLPYDMTAFAVVILLFVLGYLQPDEVFSGFSSSAVIIFISTFFIAGAMKFTGVTERLASFVTSRVGNDEKANIKAVMLMGVCISAFISNIAAAALLLPAVVSIAQINNIHLSRLLIPLAFACVIGGMLTVIGSTGNIVALDLQEKSGIEKFHFFDFTIFGVAFAIVGIIYVAYFGRRRLPKRTLLKNNSGSTRELRKLYRLNEQIFALNINPGNYLVGKTIANSNLAGILGIRIVSLFSGDARQIYPNPKDSLKANDRLLVYGSQDTVQSLLQFEDSRIKEVGSNSPLKLFKFDEKKEIEEFQDLDNLRLVSIKDSVEFISINDFSEEKETAYALYYGDSVDLTNATEVPDLLKSKTFYLEINEKSKLIGSKIVDLKSVRHFGFKICGIERNGKQYLLNQDLTLESGDCLICFGNKEILENVLKISGLLIEKEVTSTDIESADVAITEVVLSPRSSLLGKTLIEIGFREKYDFQVLAIWRQGKPLRGNLSETKLQLGDALLLQGPRSKTYILDEDSDFLLLFDIPESSRSGKAKYALLSLALMVFLSGFSIMPVPVASMLAAVLVVFTGALKIDEAYKEVSWRVVFLVAALMPFGIAFERTGAAAYVSDLILNLTGSGNFYLTLIVLAFAASLISQALDVVISVVLVGQIAITISEKLMIDPSGLLMAVTLAASFAFMTPFSHKANLLVMGAGGYRVRDYFRVGTALTLILLILLVIMIPLVYELPI